MAEGFDVGYVNSTRRPSFPQVGSRALAALPPRQEITNGGVLTTDPSPPLGRPTLFFAPTSHSHRIYPSVRATDISLQTLLFLTPGVISLRAFLRDPPQTSWGAGRLKANQIFINTR